MRKIEKLEDKKGYATGKQFEHILDEIHDLDDSLERILKCQEWLKYNDSDKYKVSIQIIK